MRRPSFLYFRGEHRDLREPGEGEQIYGKFGMLRSSGKIAKGQRSWQPTLRSRVQRTEALRRGARRKTGSEMSEEIEEAQVG